MTVKTYTAAAIGVAFASNKSMLGVFNAHVSRKVKLYRVWQLNNQTSAVTGVIAAMVLRKISSFSGGTGVTPVGHDSANTALDLTNITTLTNGTFGNTADAILRQWIWSNDEPAVSGATSDEFECIVPLMCVWDSTGDSNIEPLVANTTEGYHVLQPGANAVGITDVFMEFNVFA